MVRKNHSTYDFNSYNSPKRLLLEGFEHWVREKMDQGWKAHIVTIMFNQIPGLQATILTRMRKEIERIYATILTRIVRNPMSERNADKLPIWICCPDFPVPKHQKESLRNVIVNDGLHFHVICLIPPDSRFQQSLKQHVSDHQDLYKGKVNVISNLHVRRIRNRPAHTTDYMLKSIKRGRVDDSEIIVLPRSKTELKNLPGNWAELYAPYEKMVQVTEMWTRDGFKLL